MKFESYKLSELVQIIGGGTPKRKVEIYWNGDIPWLSVKDFNDKKRWVHQTDETITEKGLNESSTKLLKTGDLIISARGTVGEIAQLAKPMAFNQSCYGLRAHELLTTNDYLYYWIRYNVNYVKNNTHGSVFDTITRNTFDNLIVKLPPKEYQNKVVKVPTMIDKKIELNNAIISNLEELAQTLFKRWFVDFEFPNEEGKPYKSSGGKMVESELGMIPEGWEVKQLNEVVRHSKKSFNPNRENQIAVAHFSLPAYDSQQYPAFEDSKTIKSNKYYIDENSVMFSRMNPKTPRTWLPNIQSKYINVCSSEYVVLDTSLYANKGYIFSLISSNEFNNYLINNATGSTNSRQRVRPEVALQYAFAFDENVAKEFEQKIGSFYKEITSLREEIFTLSNLRDTLLPKLLSGEIELPDDMEVTDDVPIS